MSVATEAEVRSQWWIVLQYRHVLYCGVGLKGNGIYPTPYALTEKVDLKEARFVKS